MLKKLTRMTAPAAVVTATFLLGPVLAATSAQAVKPKLPSKPVVTAVVAGAGAVQVSWTAGSPGGSAITGYVVKAVQGGVIVANCTPSPAGVTASSSSCVLSGLTPGVEAAVSVSARSGVGLGLAGTTKTTPVGAPSAPQIQSTTRTGSKVTVTWKAGSSNGAAISSFDAEGLSTSGARLRGCTHVAPARKETCTLSGAAPSAGYVVTVVATNSYGTGPTASSTVAAVTPGAATSTTLGLDKSWVAPGGQVTATATAFAARTTVSVVAIKSSGAQSPHAANRAVSLSPRAVAPTSISVDLGTTMTDGSGNLTDTLTIPPSMASDPVGTYDIVATGLSSTGSSGSEQAPLQIGFDTKPPVLVDAAGATPLSVTSTSSDTTESGQVVTVSAEVYDALSGVSGVTAYLLSANFPAIRCQLSSFSGDVHDGVWQSTCAIPRYTEGSYAPVLEITSAAGTCASYGWQDVGFFGFCGRTALDTLGYQESDLTTTFTDSSASLNGPLSIDPAGTAGAFSLGATSVSVTSGNATSVPFTFGFSGLPRGSAYSFAWIDENPPAGSSWFGYPAAPGLYSDGTICATTCTNRQGSSTQLVSGTLAHGIFQGAIFVPPSAPSGTYRLVLAVISGDARQATQYGDGTLAGASSITSLLGYTGADTSFSVASNAWEPVPSATGPQMLSSANGGQLSLSAHSIDSVNGPQSVTVTLGGLVADPGFNITRVQVLFANGSNSAPPLGFLQYDSGAGTWSGRVDIPQYGYPGTWSILFIAFTETTPDGQVVAVNSVLPGDLGFSADQCSFTNAN